MGTRARLQETFKFALAVTLAYWVALALDWDLPKYAALAVALISLSSTGASLNKGLARIAGTVLGTAAAWFLLAWFAQDRWAFMAAMAAYLSVCAWFLQRSSVPYAWFVSGLVALIVWKSSYMHVGDAFHFGVFRFLETATGVTILTLVAALLWPRRAGDQLAQLGGEVFATLRAAIPRDGTEPDEARDGGAKLAGLLPKVRATLTAAYADTGDVSRRRATWETVPASLARVANAVACLRLAAEEVRAAGVEDALEATTALDALDRRLESAAALWAQALAPSTDTTPETETVPPFALSDVDARLSLAARAAVAGLHDALRELDLATGALHTSLQVLAGRALSLESPARPAAAGAPSPPSHLWDARRFGMALLPGVSFVVGFCVWILTDPPGGAGVPEMAGIFGLLTLLLLGRRALVAAAIAMGKGLVCVAPVYFFLLPGLGGGPGVFVVIFAFSALFGWLGVTRPMLRLGAMVMFVLVTNFTNDQSYTLFAFVNTAFMVQAGALIALLVFELLAPDPAGSALVRGVGQFFDGCATLVAGTARAGGAARMRAAARRVHGAQRRIAFPARSANSSEGVSRLVGSIDALALRFAALESARREFDARGADAFAPVASTAERVSGRLRTAFEELARHEPGPALDEERAALRAAALGLEEELDREAPESREPSSSSAYALLGSLRGLVHAVEDTRTAVQGVAWEEWSASRF